MSEPIVFPAVTSPQVSIIIVTHGARRVVAEALAALAAHTAPVYEVIIVDSASPDDTGPWLETNVRGARLIRRGINIGYGAGGNLGTELARGTLLLFMNPDVLPLPGWLPPLVDAVALPFVAAAGPQLRHLDGALQAAGSMIDRDGRSARYGDGDRDPDAPAYAYPRTPDYLSGACLLVHRRLFDRVGGFDLCFGLGYFEDVDLCFALAALGYRLLYVANSAVRHLRDASGGSRTLALTVAQNQRTFVERWHGTLRSRPRGSLQRDPARIQARDARATLRALVLGEAAACVPTMLAHDARLAITVAGSAATAAGPGVEVVAEVDDWRSWLGARRHHYDLVIGSDHGMDAFVDATQPLARRLTTCGPAELIAAGSAPWPPIFEPLPRLGAARP
jgi:GT2 family glycosyltransferase